MIKIVVDSSEIVERRGVSKTSGNEYHLRIQTAYAFTVKDSGAVSQFPDKFEILLDKDIAPYAPGNYTLAPSAVFVGRDGRIELRPRLAALNPSKQ